MWFQMLFYGGHQEENCVLTLNTECSPVGRGQQKSQLHCWKLWLEFALLPERWVAEPKWTPEFMHGCSHARSWSSGQKASKWHVLDFRGISIDRFSLGWFCLTVRPPSRWWRSHRRWSSRLLQETVHGFIGASAFPAAVGTRARRAARDEIPKRFIYSSAHMAAIVSEISKWMVCRGGWKWLFHPSHSCLSFTYLFICFTKSFGEACGCSGEL